MTTLPGPADNEDLPRVPLPGLRASCEQFLAWCAPLLGPADLATTRAAVDGFLAADSPAWALHDELVAYNRRSDVGSWLDDFWRTRYLGRRDRIALNANFFFLFPDAGTGQAARAAGLVAAAVDYKIALDAGGLETPMQRGAPLSTEQNKYLFSATRIPGRDIDSSRSPYTPAWPGPSAARHVLVLHGGRPYRLDALDEDGAPYPPDALAAAFAAVLADPVPAEPHPIGALTTMARAEWAQVRDRLRDADPANADALDAVETALLCVSLDDVPEASVPGLLAASDQLLHGNAGNRWFDKALTFVVLADGTAGVNGEHCNLDGTTVATMVDTLLEPDRRAAIRTQAYSTRVPATAEPIHFVLDDELKATVDRAAEDFRAFAAATASTTVSFDVGAGAAKAGKASPDAVVQMAIQLAHHRARGVIGATYESISMRQYRNGRTEAMRVVTPQSVTFVHAMADPANDRAARERSLRAAIEAHSGRARGCQTGEAPEQHLWELQLIAARRGEPVPALYDSPGWQIMRADYLSTSSVPSPYLASFGFGSTSPTCIGVGYVLLEDSLQVYLSTPRTEAHGMHRFADELRAALPEVLDLLAEGARGR